MRLLAWVRRPQPARQPGRHSAEWAQFLQERQGLRREVRDLEHRCDGLKWDRDAALDEVEDLKQRHAREISGWQDALKLADTEAMGIAQELERAEAERDRLAEEVKDLRRLMSASTGEHGYTVPAPIDQGCRDTPQAAEETVQATLADLEATGERPLLDLLSGLRAAKGPKPPLPPAPRPSGTAATAVLPLYDATLPVRTVKPAPPVEASPVTGQRARDAVAEAVADLADAHS